MKIKIPSPDSALTSRILVLILMDDIFDIAFVHMFVDFNSLTVTYLDHRDPSVWGNGVFVFENISGV